MNHTKAKKRAGNTLVLKNQQGKLEMKDTMVKPHKSSDRFMDINISNSNLQKVCQGNEVQFPQ